MRPFPLSALTTLTLTSLACGGAATAPTSVYTAEQLNAVATHVPEEDGPPSEPRAASSPSNDGSDVPPPQPAGLRVLHASSDRSLASLSAFLDDSAVAAVEGLTYKSLAGYLELPPGPHGLLLRRANTPTNAPPVLSFRTDALDAAGRYTAVVHGLAAGTPRLAVTVSADFLAPPEEGKARLRFFHALVGLGAIDLCLPGTPARRATANQPAQPAVAPSPVFANVPYGAFGTAQGGTYTDVTAGAALTLQLRAQNARPCTGAVRGTVTFTPPSATILTAVVVGRVVGAPPVPRELLLCTDGPVSGAPSCQATPIR
jgi:hypothetical protein